MLNLDRHLMTVTHRPPVVMVRGQGSYLWDDSGKRYLDFVQGWATNTLGHAAPELVSALSEQAGQLWSASPAFHNAPHLRLGARLTEVCGMERVAFATSGAEANDAAIKLCRKWGRRHKPGAYKIVTTWRAFHGRTLAAMAASGKPGWDELFPPNLPGFERVEFGDLDAMERAIDDEVVAVMLEPIQGEAGVRVPSREYLGGLRRLTDERNCLLVFDEIQTGIGRTGSWFAKDHFGVAPDVMTLGKGLGSGIPLSAVLANQRADCFEAGDFGGTHLGNPLLASVGLAVLEAVGEPGFLEHVRARGEQLTRGLKQLQRAFHLRDTRGVGLLQAVEFDEPVAESVRDQAMHLGLLLNAAQPNVIRLVPSLRVTRDELDEGLGTLERALCESLAPERPTPKAIPNRKAKALAGASAHGQRSSVKPPCEASLPRQQRQVS